MNTLWDAGDNVLNKASQPLWVSSVSLAEKSASLNRNKIAYDMSLDVRRDRNQDHMVSDYVYQFLMNKQTMVGYDSELT